MDYIDQPFCPRKCRPYHCQHDNPVLLRKLFGEVGWRAESSYSLFCWGYSWKYLLPVSWPCLFNSGRSFRSHFCPRRSPGGNDTEAKGSRIPDPGSPSALDSCHWGVPHTFPHPASSVASSSWRSHPRSYCRLLLQEKGTVFGLRLRKPEGLLTGKCHISLLNELHESDEAFSCARNSQVLAILQGRDLHVNITSECIMRATLMRPETQSTLW